MIRSTDVSELNPIRSFSIRGLMCGCAVLLLTSQWVHSQEHDSNAVLSVGRTSLQVQAALKPLLEKISPSVVELESQYGKRSLGTIVSSDGLIVAKYSELTDKFFCLLDTRKVQGKLLGAHLGHDLALIKVNAKDLRPVSFSTAPTASRPGKFVVSITNEDDAAALGLVSVAPQRFGIEQPPCDNCIDLGVTVSRFTVKQRIIFNNVEYEVHGLAVERVYPRTVSERSGLLVGDLLQSVNGKLISSRAELDQVAKTLRIGQELKISVLRDGKVKDLSTRINGFSPRMVHDRWGGGPFSEKRFGFQEVISHDSVVDPEHCGGPLTDLQGRLVGINISRSMRVATFAIPIQDVHHFILRVRPNADLKYLATGTVATNLSR